MEFVINGVKLEANLLNPKIARSYEEAIDICKKEIIEAEKETRGSKGLEVQCQAVINLVGAVFGKDAIEPVFGEETDLFTCLDVCDEMFHIYERQVNPVIEKRTREFSSSRAKRK